MNYLDQVFQSVNKLCDDDNACTMIIFVLVGFMLCYLFSNKLDGYDNFNNHAPVDNELIQQGGNNIAKPIGIELNKRIPESTPSTERQLKVVSSMAIEKETAIAQKPGILIQDSMIFKPFDEIWNPGFMPLDMVFKNVQKSAAPLQKPLPKVGDKGTEGSPGKDLKIILLYAPWCGHSKKMLPDYERVKSEYDGSVINGNKVSIIMYNSDVDKDKVKEYGVKGFPTLFVERDGIKESFPHRTYDKIVEYIKSA